MSVPSLLEIGSTVALLVLFIGAADLLYQVLRLRPEHLTVVAPRREVTLALMLVVTIFISTSIMEAFRFLVYRPAFGLDERAPSVVDQYNVLFTCVFYMPWFILLLVVTRHTGLDRRGVGVVGTGGARLLTFGIGLGTIYFVVVGLFASLFGGGFSGLSPSLAWGLVDNGIISLAEETVWRGYVQTRVVAFAGTLKGVLATSLLFALLHFPQRYFIYSGAVLEALSSAILVWAAGLLFGYVMMRSQSIIPSSILHLFGNWSALFWNVSSF